ncbi:hypothetical protein [Halolamina salifodinae]|uniref:Uncharacterized protein n=1 Tax=Halolamina salifodinae TaxID=1202767 RepID=A0A8T4GZM2_9EURY|nr:hypothetical protein [Halolamina salifodinae]MBP1986994.1 hypothetical protein [Halolamina salifodinae]
MLKHIYSILSNRLFCDEENCNRLRTVETGIDDKKWYCWKHAVETSKILTLDLVEESPGVIDEVDVDDLLDENPDDEELDEMFEDDS